MTLQRVGLCLSLCSMLACSDGVAAPLQRPSPTRDPVAAVVLHVVGAVQVTPATGAAFAAAPPQDLVDSDLLTPAEGAFVVVSLTNGHLVRIDDVGALQVGQILLKKAPPATRDVASQLAALLEPGEQVAPAAIVERAAAWRHMKRAGETAGRGAAKERSIASTEDVAPGRGGSGPPPATAPMPVTSAPPPRAPEPQKATSKRRSAPREEAVSNEAKKDAPPPPEAGIADDAMAPPPAQAPAAPPPTEPGLQAAFGAKATTTTALPTAPFLGGGIAACLEETARVHSLPVGEIVLLVEVKGGLVARVRFAGALPPTTCATGLVDRPVAVADGWLRLSR